MKSLGLLSVMLLLLVWEGYAQSDLTTQNQAQVTRAIEEVFEDIKKYYTVPSYQPNMFWAEAKVADDFGLELSLDYQEYRRRWFDLIEQRKRSRNTPGLGIEGLQIQLQRDSLTLGRYFTSYLNRGTFAAMLRFKLTYKRGGKNVIETLDAIIQLTWEQANLGKEYHGKVLSIRPTALNWEDLGYFQEQKEVYQIEKTPTLLAQCGCNEYTFYPGNQDRLWFAYPTPETKTEFTLTFFTKNNENGIEQIYDFVPPNNEYQFTPQITPLLPSGNPGWTTLNQNCQPTEVLNADTEYMIGYFDLNEYQDSLLALFEKKKVSGGRVIPVFERFFARITIDSVDFESSNYFHFTNKVTWYFEGDTAFDVRLTNRGVEPLALMKGEETADFDPYFYLSRAPNSPFDVDSGRVIIEVSFGDSTVVVDTIQSPRQNSRTGDVIDVDEYPVRFYRRAIGNGSRYQMRYVRERYKKEPVQWVRQYDTTRNIRWAIQVGNPDNLEETTTESPTIESRTPPAYFSFADSAYYNLNARNDQVEILASGTQNLSLELVCKTPFGFEIKKRLISPQAYKDRYTGARRIRYGIAEDENAFNFIWEKRVNRQLLSLRYFLQLRSISPEELENPFGYHLRYLFRKDSSIRTQQIPLYFDQGQLEIVKTRLRRSIYEGDTTLAIRVKYQIDHSYLDQHPNALVQITVWYADPNNPLNQIKAQSFREPVVFLAREERKYQNNRLLRWSEIHWLDNRVEPGRIFEINVQLVSKEDGDTQLGEEEDTWKNSQLDGGEVFPIIRVQGESSSSH